MAFDGYVVSDSGAIDFLVSQYHRFPNKSVASVAAVSAGVDLNSGGCFTSLSASVAAGAVQESVLDVALTRLFTSRIKLGCFDPPASVSYTKIPPAAVATAASTAAAVDVAQRSLVLLKNDPAGGFDGAPLLPLTPAAVRANGRPLRIGWGGSIGHLEDLRHIAPALQQWLPQRSKFTRDHGRSVSGGCLRGHGQGACADPQFRKP